MTSIRQPPEPGVAARRSPTGRIRGLDGLRGAAVVAVLLFHAGHLVGGYLGVDLFFVLSGFLITGLLLTEWEGHGRVRLGAFWARRARRLLPALFVMLFGVAAYTALVASPTQFASIRADALSTLGYVANWHSILAGHSYWTLFSAPSPLDHTWSLAIEEQFYLVWPLIVVGLAIRVRRRDQLAPRVLAVALVGAVGLGVLAVSLAALGASTNRVYLGTDTRAPAILLGAAFAALCAGRAPVRSTAGRIGVEVAGLVGLAWLGWAWTHFDGQDPFLARGGLLLCGVAAVLVIAAVVHPLRGPIAALASIAPLCWLGLISYGLYLWHWPVYVWLNTTRTGVHGWTLTGLRVAVSLTLAVASYFLVELPIRHGALRGWSIRVVAPAAAALTLIVVLVATAGAVNPASTVETASAGRHVAATPTTIPTPGSPRVLMVGDSVGVSLGARLDEIQGAVGISVVNLAKIGCELPMSDYYRKPAGDDGPAGEPLLTSPMCRDWPTQWAAQLAEVHPSHVVLSMGFPAVEDIQIRGVWHTACSSWWRRYYRAEATTALRLLGSTGAHVWVATIARPGKDYFPPSLDTGTECVNRLLRDAAAAAHASVLDLDGYLCPGKGRCGSTLDGQELRPDGLHFANPGGRLLAVWVARQLTVPPH
jgi:peptidoglycan/LPS O-acetylase OafA/YrhL